MSILVKEDYNRRSKFYSMIFVILGIQCFFIMIIQSVILFWCVAGPLDETGYYIGEVRGRTGLVPADYLRPAEGRNGRWKGIMGEKLPPYLDASPERIVQTHYQMQQSHTPTHNGN